MVDERFHSAEWFKALTLRERIASLRDASAGNQGAIPDAARAARRLQRWKGQAPFTDRAVFARRLAADGLTEPELTALLADTHEAVRARSEARPAWLSALRAAFSRTPSAPGLPFDVASNPQAALLNLVAPLVDAATDRLRADVDGLARGRATLPFDPASAIRICAEPLQGSLLAMVGRTLVLELNVARLEGELAGDTPQERFRSFAERLSRPEVAVSLLQEYPVLARQVVKVLDRWVAVSAEFLRHLRDDGEAIRDTFAGGGDPGPLVELHGSGDTHRGGRRVVVAAFSSGFRVVYKPRSLAVERHFQDLLSWLNARGATPPFRTLRVLDRGAYGWVEFATPGGCTSAVEIERFYERLGGYLALFHALAATDFHAENLLAMGEHPVPIDLEALFHPRPQGLVPPHADEAARALERSVTRIGLLPERIWATAESPGVDLSGLGGTTEGQLTPFSVPQWKDEATDTMQLVRERAPMLAAQNQPTLDGAPVSLLDHTGAIETGFERTYRLLLSNRENLLEEGGPLERFADDEVRAILRMSQTYAALLRESFHPDMLRDALDRDRLLDRLWMQVGNAPHLERVTPSEREELLEGDIPMFTARPRSRDAWAGTGERIPELFEASGLDEARRQIRALSEPDLARQLWLVRASLATVATGVDSKVRRAAPDAVPPGVVDRERLISTARAIGERLGTLALRGQGGASWWGLNLLDDRHWTVTPLGVDLYDGLPGVALFLAHLGAATGDDRHTALARAAMATLRRQLPHVERQFTGIGAFSGWSGVAYAFGHLGALWDDPECLDQAERIVDMLPELVAQDDQLDVIGGAAGCIGALLAVYRVRPSAKALAVAIACGDHLDARAVPVPGAEGRAVTTRLARRPLSGFSHGAAGMAWALLELADVTGEERFRATALDLIRYERTLFAPDLENWLDVRELAPSDGAPAAPRTCCTFWCHGAPGIGLARLVSRAHLDDAATREEIAVAVRTTSREGFGTNHSLCHGDLGNLELLLHAGGMPGGPSRADVDRAAAKVVASIERDGWLCGNPQAIESPGLMTGLAGIGYGLLRVADTTSVPSLLALAPPMTGCR